MPPAIPVYKATQIASCGPSQAPRAASSLTSPAPSPPSANGKKNTAAPTTQPAPADSSAAHPPETPAKTIAASAAPSVSTFGIRRLRRSVTHAAAATDSAMIDVVVINSTDMVWQLDSPGPTGRKPVFPER